MPIEFGARARPARARARGWRRPTASRGPVDPETLILDVSAKSVGLEWCGWPIGVGRTRRRLDWRRRGWRRRRRRGPRSLSDGEAQSDPGSSALAPQPVDPAPGLTIARALRIHPRRRPLRCVSVEVEAPVDADRIRAAP